MIDELRDLRKEYHLNQKMGTTFNADVLKTTASEKSSRAPLSNRENPNQRT